MNIGGRALSSLRDPYVLAVSAISLVVLSLFVIWRLQYTASLSVWAIEDGPIENATAILYFAAAVVFGLIAFRKDDSADNPMKFRRGFLLLWAAACFVMAGEEISWGQRILNFETPASLAAVNYHQETNFHNLDFVLKYLADSKTAPLGISIHPLIMIFVGFLFPLSAATNTGRRTIRKYGFPVVPAAYLVLIIGALFYGKILAANPNPTNDAGEVREFFWGIAIFLYAVHGYYRPWELYRSDEPAEA
jgi:hypothetical protein